MKRTMKLLMILGIVLGSVGAFGSPPARSHELQGNLVVKQKTKRLGLSISTDRQKYKRHGKIRITVMLTNVDYVEEIFVYGSLGAGYLSSLTYTIRDASGNPVVPTILDDDLPFPLNRNDTTAFVKLLPDHFLGTNYIDTLDRLNLKRPGKYSILVEYHSPISATQVSLRNFWSKEDGTIKSNVVYVEVLR